MAYYKTIGGKRYRIIVNDLNKGDATSMAAKHRRGGRYANVRVVRIAGRWGVCVR